MVFLKHINWKLGIRPSVAANFNYKNLTPTQKLMLARCRIFKTTLNTGFPTGLRKLEKPFGVNEDIQSYQIPMHNVK